jgi:PAS domain S-box-containing protein
MPNSQPARLQEVGRHRRKRLLVGCIEVDSKLNVVHIDSEACRLFGYTPDEVLGENVVHVLVSEFEAREVRKFLQKMLKGNVPSGPIPNGNWNRTRSGKERFLFWSNERIVRNNGQVGLRFTVRVLIDGPVRHSAHESGVLIESDDLRILSGLQNTPPKTRRVLARFFALASDPKQWKRTLRNLKTIFDGMNDEGLVECFAEAAKLVSGSHGRDAQQEDDGTDPTASNH